MKTIEKLKKEKYKTYKITESKFIQKTDEKEITGMEMDLFLKTDFDLNFFIENDICNLKTYSNKKNWI